MHALCRVPHVFKVGEINRRLVDMRDGLVAIAFAPPDKPIADRDIREATEKVYEIASKFHARMQETIVPFSYYRFFVNISWAVYRLLQLIYYISSICGTVEEMEKKGVRLSPNPCHTHTLDSHVESLISDFKKYAERAEPVARRVLHPRHVSFDYPVKNIEEGGKGFLERLQILSSLCMLFMGANCLKYASPEKVTPASLRSYILDLASAVGIVRRKLMDECLGVKEWKVGDIRLYECPGTTGELLDLAEYVANVLHKMIEIEIAPLVYADSVWVFSLKDRVEVMLRRDVGGLIAKPGWIVDVHSYPVWEDNVEVLRRIFSEGGFKTEPVERVVGFRVVASPDDVREAVKLACMLPAIPHADLVGHGGAYQITISRLKQLESALWEHRPLTKRKPGL
jgi:hypothetical protein